MKKLCNRLFFDKSWNLLKKIAKSRFVPPCAGGTKRDFGHMVTWFCYHIILALIAPQPHGVEALWADIGRNCAVWKVGACVTFSANFRGKGSCTNDFWRQKIRVPGLSRRCLRDPTFSPFDAKLACDRQTDTQTDTHTMTAISRASLAPRG